jgi:hypothetical protein
MTEDQVRELFREMREDPVPPDSSARVRLAVAERRRNWAERLRGHWKIAAAVLVPMCAVLIAMLAREPARVLRPPAVVKPIAAEETATLTEIPVAEASAVRPHPVARRTIRTVTRMPGEQSAEGAVPGVVIRIETPDPDVVILLVGG